MLLGGGLAAPAAWYKIQTTAGSIRAEDDKRMFNIKDRQYALRIRFVSRFQRGV